MALQEIDSTTHQRLARKAPFCTVLKSKISSLAEYLEVFDALFTNPHDPFWFRGHDDISWVLCPSALRYSDELIRERAINSLSEFRRIQEYRFPKAPGPDEVFKWMQIGQHHGLPTRLLDWTQSLATALYFACENPARDGLVIAINPRDLNRVSLPKQGIDVVDPHANETIIRKYFSLGSKPKKRGLKTVAVKPAWNSDRIILQQGMFTLHGDEFCLDKKQAPSLIGVPILQSVKLKLRHQLERIGVAEMFIFPEPEHVCSYIKRRIESL
jgi:hypothetical protein